jgi:hypothetical protein
MQASGYATINKSHPSSQEPCGNWAEETHFQGRYLNKDLGAGQRGGPGQHRARRGLEDTSLENIP